MTLDLLLIGEGLTIDMVLSLFMFMWINVEKLSKSIFAFELYVGLRYSPTPSWKLLCIDDLGSELLPWKNFHTSSNHRKGSPNNQKNAQKKQVYMFNIKVGYTLANITSKKRIRFNILNCTISQCRYGIATHKCNYVSSLTAHKQKK